jgi:hypothetical protein
MRVSEYFATVPSKGGGLPKRKVRWRAQFEGHDRGVEECCSRDEAIGKLILDDLVESFTLDWPSPETFKVVRGTFESIAALFRDLAVCSAEESIGKAVFIAATHPKRKHSGLAVKVELLSPETVAAERKPRKTVAPKRPASLAMAGEGGAA